MTSAAGLWSRGGGQVKALVPLNVADCLSADKLTRLRELSAFTKKEHCLLVARQNPRAGESEDEAVARLQDAAAKEIEQLFAEARAQPQALTPLAMKFVNVALMSHAARTYIPFDIWTSEQTHSAVHDYVQEFKRTYAQTTFHDDPRIQAHIVRALGRYFRQAERRGDTHLFGVQRGFAALDPETGAPIPGTPLIGKGAGRAKAYLDMVGRTEELLARGKTTMIFDNIEVVSELSLLFGAHARHDAEVSVVIVPQRPGYVGGNPVRVTRDGRTSMELHEQSALPEDLLQGHEFFNANTIIQPLTTDPPSAVAFESKREGAEMRVKQNACDITHEVPTEPIGGRIGHEYENFKFITEVIDHGVSYVGNVKSTWRASPLRWLSLAAVSLASPRGSSGTSESEAPPA
jgi:hypothetical protein